MRKKLLTNEQVATMLDVLTRPSIKDFYKEGVVHKNDAKGKEDESYVFIDGGPEAKVLAVGHCDWVMFSEPKMNQERSIVACPQLDDRLGVWLIMHFFKACLPKDMPYDILLTDFEERGNSTAKLFEAPEGKKYNWMFEFDRRGTDTVMYDYETKELKELLTAEGFKVGQGSFTDICQLAGLGCAGFNFGTGYHGEHSMNCYADLRETASVVDVFRKFYAKYYHTHLEGNQKAAQSRKDRKNGTGGYSSGYDYWQNNHSGYQGGYRNYKPYVDRDISSPNSILFITQYGGGYAKPCIVKDRPINKEHLIGLCNAKGEVLVYPKDKISKQELREVELGYGVRDHWKGEFKAGSLKWEKIGILTLRKSTKTKESKEAIKTLAQDFAKELGKQDEAERLWIDDEMIADWDRESARRLIGADEKYPDNEDEIDFVDDPTDSELEAIITNTEIKNIKPDV